MTLYGVYKEYRTGAYTIGQAEVIKETEKYYYVERNQSFGFASRIDKPVAMANHASPALAIACHLRQKREWLDICELRVLDAQSDYINARNDLEQVPA